jgi:hypothetical protein
MLINPKISKTVLLFLCLFIIGEIFAFSNTSNPLYSVVLIPDSLLDNAHTVIRYNELSYKVHTIGKATKKVKAVITILNKNSNATDLQVYYDQFRKVGKIKARIYDKHGQKIRDIGKSEIKDYAAFDGFSIYNDSRLKHIDFSYGTYPYTIEYEYDVTQNGLQSYASWYPQSYKTSIEKSVFEFSIPIDINFRHQATNLKQSAVISRSDGNKKYVWELNHKIAISKEPYTPADFNPFPVVLTLPNQFEVDDYKGNMATWQSFGKFMYELNKGRDELSPVMQQKVKALTANATSDLEKIELLYNYLKENMRYVSVQLGIGGWQTFDANYVEQNKYGDCKALTNFMKGMLKTAGIKSYAALITAGRQRIKIKEDFTTPYFNHVILNIPDKDIWLECTSNSSPVNYLGAGTHNRPSLLITENGGVLTKTPAISDNKQIGKTIISLTDKGAAKVESTTKLTGILHEYYRSVMNDSKEEQAKWLRNSQDFSTFDIEKLSISAEKVAPISNCDYTINVSRYASKAGKRLFVPINLVNQLKITLPKTTQRKYPLVMKLAYEDIDEIIIKLPTSHKVESLPKKNQVLESPYGSYKVEIEEQEGQIIYKRNLKLNAIEIPPSEYEDLRKFYKAVRKMDNVKMVLVLKPA